MKLGRRRLQQRFCWRFHQRGYMSKIVSLFCCSKYMVEMERRKHTTQVQERQKLGAPHFVSW